MIGYLIIATITVILVCLLLCFYDVLDVSTIFANIVTGGMLIVLFSTYSSTEKEKRKEKERQSAKKREADERQITAAKVVYLPTLKNIYLKTRHFTRRQQWVLLRYCQEVKNSEDDFKAREKANGTHLPPLYDATICIEIAEKIKQIIYDGIGLGNGEDKPNTPREWFGTLESASIQLTDKEIDALLKISQTNQPEFIALAMIVSKTLSRINDGFPNVYDKKIFGLAADYPPIFKDGEINKDGEKRTRTRIEDLILCSCLLTSALSALTHYLPKSLEFRTKQKLPENLFDFLHERIEEEFLNVIFSDRKDSFDTVLNGNSFLSPDNWKLLKRSSSRKIIEDKDKFYKMLEEHCGKELARDAFNRP